jgi:ABC-type branched-subunit amino acid transport system ATPase component
MGSSSLLNVSGLYKNFGGVQAISDLNFEIIEGELLGSDRMDQARPPPSI